MKKQTSFFKMCQAFCLAFLLFGSVVHAQQPVHLNRITQNKVLSGLLFEQSGFVQNDSGYMVLKNAKTTPLHLILYLRDYPGDNQLKQLEALGVKLMNETWTPPVGNHPYGYLFATVPCSNLQKVLEIPEVLKAGVTGRGFRAQNNDAAISIKAPLVWDNGLTGKGVTIGILDSGIDTTYKGSELPASFRSKDYSYYPNLDNNVLNTYSGHGTHVAATALGRGILSASHNHPNNGKGSFKGMAPGADLVLLKIGQDDDAFAYDSCIIAAIDAAVNIYHVNILSMSYGGWDEYHDGTSALEQKVDWAYSKGVPFFCSAGNDCESNKHWMGTIPANSESDFLELAVTDPKKDSLMLRFNMVCQDGTKRTNLKLQYYDSLKNLLPAVVTLPTTQSLKGTESAFSYYSKPLTAKGKYFLKVINQSAWAQEVHLYEDWSGLKIGSDHVRFIKGECAYTIGSPSTADHAFSVGAYISKTSWTSSYDNKSYWYGASSVLSKIAPFSSHGPRMDGKIKPDISAPGSVVLSLRDTKVYTTPNYYWIDNDGIKGGSANYYAMRGTSMACPVVSGAAALFLEKFPNAAPDEVYTALRNFSDRSGLGNLPDNTWGNGKLDIFSAVQKSRDTIQVDGNMNEPVYATPGKSTAGRDGMGIKNNAGELKFFSDGKNLFIGITGEVSEWNSLILYLGFSGVNGRGSKTLGAGDPADSLSSVVEHTNNLKMDFDVDFALAFGKKSSSAWQFFLDGIRYGTTNKSAYIGKCNQMGASSTAEIGSLFGGKGYITFAYDTGYSVNHSKGIEMKIPVSAFAGVDTTQTLQLFALISGWWGEASNECIPGDAGKDNPGSQADFSAIAGQDFFTKPFKITRTIVTDIRQKTTSANGSFDLGQNYPNPFRSITTIDYVLSDPGTVRLEVFDHTGKKVTTLAEGFQPAGNNSAQWNGTGHPPGLYFYRLTAGNQAKTMKMILME